MYIGQIERDAVANFMRTRSYRVLAKPTYNWLRAQEFDERRDIVYNSPSIFNALAGYMSEEMPC